MRLALAVALIAFTAGRAQPQASIAGVGAMSCKVAAPMFMEDEFRLMVLSWATGFISGVNMDTMSNASRYRDLSSVDGAATLGRLLRYCVQHPGESLFRGVEPMLADFPIVK